MSEVPLYRGYPQTRTRVCETIRCVSLNNYYGPKIGRSAGLKNYSPEISRSAGFIFSGTTPQAFGCSLGSWGDAGPRCFSQHPGGGVWVGHRPGQARLWMGVGAIVTFGFISGSVSSDEYTDRNCMLAHMRRVMPARDPHRL